MEECYPHKRETIETFTEDERSISGNHQLDHGCVCKFLVYVAAWTLCGGGRNVRRVNIGR